MQATSAKVKEKRKESTEEEKSHGFKMNSRLFADIQKKKKARKTCIRKRKHHLLPGLTRGGVRGSHRLNQTVRLGGRLVRWGISP